MLFHTTWEFRDNSEEAIQRNLAFFSQWKPPDGFEFKGFWGYADGSGGVAIVETDSAARSPRRLPRSRRGCDSAPPRSFPSRKRRRSLAKPPPPGRPSAARPD